MPGASISNLFNNGLLGLDNSNSFIFVTKLKLDSKNGSNPMANIPEMKDPNATNSISSNIFFILFDNNIPLERTTIEAEIAI